jgi:signal transduction histidine kinase
MHFQPLNDIFFDYTIYLNYILLIIPFYFYLKFARSFLDLASLNPRMNKLIRKAEYWVLALTGIVVLISVFISVRYGYTAAFLSVLLLSLFTIYLIFYFIRQKNKLNRFLLIGSLYATTGHAFAMILSVFQFIDHETFPPIIATMIGISFEIFYFNTGLGYKSKFEQEQKLSAQSDLIAQMEENRKIQDRLHGIRNRIASDLHDDVGSTLGSIGLYSEVAMKQIDKYPAVAKSILHKISESSSRMMEAMSDIVWAIHSRQDEAGGLPTRMVRFASERLSLTDMHFEMHSTPECDKLNFTIEARRNLLLLFKEAVNNASKHSNASVIRAFMEVNGSAFRLTVQDNGNGFDASVSVNGHGLLTMKERAFQLGGVCDVVSAIGAGTTVIVQVPLSRITLTANDNP